MNENNTEQSMVDVARLTRYAYGPTMMQTQDGLQFLANVNVLVPEGDPAPEDHELSADERKGIDSDDRVAENLAGVGLSVGKRVMFKRGLIYVHSERDKRPQPQAFRDGIALYVGDEQPITSTVTKIPAMLVKLMLGDKKVPVESVPLNREIASIGFVTGLSMLGKSGDTASLLRARHGEDVDIREMDLDPDTDEFALVGRAEIKGDIAVIDNGVVTAYDRLNVAFEPGAKYEVRDDLPPKLVDLVKRGTGGEVIPVKAITYHNGAVLESEDSYEAISVGRIVALVGAGSTLQETANWLPKRPLAEGGFGGFYGTSKGYPKDGKAQAAAIPSGPLVTF